MNVECNLFLHVKKNDGKTPEKNNNKYKIEKIERGKNDVKIQGRTLEDNNLMCQNYNFLRSFRLTKFEKYTTFGEKVGWGALW